MYQRQDIPHAGLGYEKPNLRLHMYADLAKTQRDSNLSTKIDLREDQLISKEVLDKNNLHCDPKNTNLKK